MSPKSADSRNGNKNKPDSSFYDNYGHEKMDENRILELLEASRLSQVLKEMTNYKLDLPGLSETRWS